LSYFVDLGRELRARLDGWERVYSASDELMAGYGIEVRLEVWDGREVHLVRCWAHELWRRGPLLGDQAHHGLGWQDALRRVVVALNPLPRERAEELAEAVLAAAQLGGRDAALALVEEAEAAAWRPLCASPA
jgi:hypothetical protein